MDASFENVVARAVIEKSGRVLLLQRAKDAVRPGEWEVPGGRVDKGENLEDAVKREVAEETGLHISNFSYMTSTNYKVEKDERLGVIFFARTETEDVTLSSEHQAYRWVDKNDVNSIKLNKHYKEFFEDYFSTKDKEDSDDNSVVKKTERVDHLIIYTDGGSRGNPGPSASGFVIMDESEHVLEEGGEYLGITTNNQAEYQAVRQALEAAARYNGKPKVDFYIDSLLVVNQLNGVYKIKNRDLWPIHEHIKKLSEKFSDISFTHVRREFNGMADAKVNEVLDSRIRKDSEANQ